MVTIKQFSWFWTPKHGKAPAVNPKKSTLISTALASGLAMFGLCVSLVVAGLSETRTAVALFPPWWSSARALAASVSAGDVVAMGGVRVAFVVRSEKAGLPDRLRAAGAVLVLTTFGAGGCGQILKTGDV